MLEYAGRPRPSRPHLCIYRPTIYARGRHTAPPPGTPHPARIGRGQPRHQSPAPHRPCGHPSRIATTCRGRGLAGLLPCLLTLCVNRAALARALIYINLDVIGGTVAGATRKRGRTTGPGRAAHGRAVSCLICRGELSHGPPMRLRPRWLSNVGNVAATWHGARCARVRERRNAGTVFAFLALGAGYNSPSPPTNH